MNEFDLIEKITKGEIRRGQGLACGIGDDCAVIKAGDSSMDWLVTTDSLIERVHFNLEWTDLYRLGRKSLSVNLSDIAAMGGNPKFYLAAVSIPPQFSEKDMKEIYRGMRDVARAYGVILVGGDTTASKKDFCITITAIGEVEGGKSILRSGAKDGDAIFVSGVTGEAALALELLRMGKSPTDGLLGRHFDPTPRINLGAKLRKSGYVSAMLDISDGLLQDVGHIADESCTGFEIFAAEIPSSPALLEMCKEYDLSPLKLSLTGGEDYELLFTVKADAVDKFKAEFSDDVYMIGRIVADDDIRRVLSLGGEELEFELHGFDHFGG